MKKSAVVKESKKVENQSELNTNQKSKKRIVDKPISKTKDNNKNKIKKIESVKQTKPKISEVKETPSIGAVKAVDKTIAAKKELVPIKEKPQQEPTIADRVLNSVMFLFFIGLIMWIISSVALRTTEVQIAVKAQTVEREVEEIERKIDGLNIEIMELKSKERLMAVAEELGLKYAWDRIKVIQD